MSVMGDDVGPDDSAHAGTVILMILKRENAVERSLSTVLLVAGYVDGVDSSSAGALDGSPSAGALQEPLWCDARSLDYLCHWQFS